MAKNILIVDDEEDVLSLLARVLQLSGFKVFRAGDGERAVSQLKSNPDIEMVLTDLNMPRMHGIALLQWITENKPEIIKGVMTGHPTERNTPALMAMDIEVFIEKPFVHFSKVVALLSAAFARHNKQPFVLVADDCRDFRRFATKVLEDANFCVATVSHHDSFELAVRDGGPSLIIADSMQDNRRTLDILNGRNMDTQFISCSCLPEDERYEYREAGAAELLTKPVPPESLLASVRRQLEACGS